MNINILIGILLLAQGHLSANHTLDKVLHTRKTAEVAYAVSEDEHSQNYECLVGLPYGFKHFIGEQVYFLDTAHMTVHGPWLVVDVEADVHQGQMAARGLMADVSCEEYISRSGIMLYYLMGVKSHERYN